jgi:nicotinamidase-related amidase
MDHTVDEILRGDDGAPTALVVVDMLNPYEHEDAERLARSVAAALPELCRLVAGARERGVPAVFVNDNYGRWNAGRTEIVEQALAGRYPELVEPIIPEPDLAFITKARHSAFYETPLEYMLRHAGIERVVLAGQVTEQCILYSALDAYVRHMQIAVPCRAVAAIREDLAAAALRMMELNMNASLL